MRFAIRSMASRGAPLLNSNGTTKAGSWLVNPVIPYVVVVLVAIVVSGVILRIWHANLRIPLYYAEGGDLLSGVVLADWLNSHWTTYVVNARLAAPLGTNFADYPLISLLHTSIQRLFSIIFRNGVVAFNLYYLAFFPLSALTSFAVLRKLQIPTVAAFAPSILFAILPYRFYRNEAHYYYAAYWLVPLTVYVSLLIAGGDPLWRRSSGAIRYLPTRGGWLALVIMAMTGADNQYHALFAMFFLIISAALGILRRRTWKPAAATAVLITFVLATVAVQMLPTFVFHRLHGRNDVAYQRYPQESQIYGLQIAQLVLPIADHRIEAFAERRAYFDAHNILNNENYTATLGSAGTFGFFVLLGVLLVGRTRPIDKNLETLAFLNVGGVLLATVGGFGAIFNYFVRDEIRAYNRIYPFLGFFALTAFAYILMFALRRLPRNVPSVAAWPIAGLIVLIGALDQTTSGMTPPYAANAAQWTRDEAFGAAVDRVMPRNAAVFDFPAFHYPEAPAIGSVLPFEQFRPYLHTTYTRWSYAASDGRAPSSWDLATAAAPSDTFVEDLILGGYQGVCIFRGAFSDGGKAVEASLARLTGPPVAVNSDGTMALYSFAALFRAAVALDPRIGTPPFIEATVENNFVVWRLGFSAPTPVGAAMYYGGLGNASAVVDNEHSGPALVHFRASAVIGARPDTLTMTLNGRPVAAWQAGPQAAPIAADITMPPGTSTLVFTTAAPPAAIGPLQGRTFALIDPSFEDPAPRSPRLEALLRRSAARAVSATPLDNFGGITVNYVRGCTQLETQGDATWHWCDRRADVQIDAEAAGRVRVTGIATTPGMPGAPVRLAQAGRSSLLAHTPRGAARFDVSLTIGPGHPGRLTFSTSARELVVAGEHRPLYLRIDDLRVNPE